jgi:hypothetical protein
MVRPTKSVPGGCLIGAFGFFCWVYAAGCVYLLLRVRRLEASAANEELLTRLIWQACIAAVLGLASVLWGWRVAMRTGAYDHWDPNEPRAKF